MISVLNFIIESISVAVSALLNLLPSSPFKWSFVQDLTEHDFWKNVNYFIPFDVISLIMISYVAAVLLWYGLRWILRFVRYIG